MVNPVPITVTYHCHLHLVIETALSFAGVSVEKEAAYLFGTVAPNPVHAK